MSYKKNQNPNIKLGFAEFDSYLGRIADNFEEKLYTDTSKTWLAICISGYSNYSVTGDKQLMSTNPRELVDLGDGVPRYKVKIRIISGGLGFNHISPTEIFPFPDLSNEAEMQYIVNQPPAAYTEGTGHVPVFGSYLMVEDIDGVYFIRNIISQSEMEFTSTIAGTTSGLFNGGNTYTPGDPNSIYGPIVEDTQQGNFFVVNNVKYISVPATNAANRAKALYDSAEAAGQHKILKWTAELRKKYPELAKKESKGKWGVNWEETVTGRQWVSTYIYEPHGKGFGERYGKRLGMNKEKYGDPEDESHWSSWFTYTALKPYKKKFAKRGGQDSGRYPGRKGYAMRVEIEKNLSQYIGQEFFCTFKSTEAPLYVGDLLFNWSGYKKVKGSTYEDLGSSKTSGAGAHMRVCVSKTPTAAIFHGGNEGAKVGKRTVELENDHMKDTKNNKKFVAIYKKVKVIGPA